MGRGSWVAVHFVRQRGSGVRQCGACLHLRGTLSTGSVSTCLASLSGLAGFIRDRNGGCTSIACSSLRRFITHLRSVNVRPHSRTEVVSKVGSFCQFLFLSSCVAASPARLLRSPGVKLGLPRILAIGRVGDVLSAVSLALPRKRQGQTVLRILCDYKLHISRLISLHFASICFSRKFVGIRKGKDGRHLIPVSRATVGRVGGCLCSHGRITIGGKFRSVLFLDQQKATLSQVVIFRVVGRRARVTNVGGGIDPRAFHRSFTARLLRKKTGLLTVRRVLKRRGVAAARVCARVSHRFLQGRVLRRRPHDGPQS